MKGYESADAFFDDLSENENELRKLRRIVLSTELAETVKWGVPVYTIDGKNVVGIGSFKSYFGIWFYQGVFLKDKAKKLVNAQEGVTKAMRQWRMQSSKDIDKTLILSYLQEAIENSKAGKEVKPEKKPLVIPPELKKVFKDDLSIKDAFDSLSLTNRRDFAEHIDTAKRVETKMSRLAKIIPMIRAGVGLNDKYKR